MRVDCHLFESEAAIEVVEAGLIGEAPSLDTGPAVATVRLLEIPRVGELVLTPDEEFRVEQVVHVADPRKTETGVALVVDREPRR